MTPRGCQWAGAGPPRALTAMTGAQAAIMMADSDAPISDGSIGVSILLVVPRAAAAVLRLVVPHWQLVTPRSLPAALPAVEPPPGPSPQDRPGHWHWHRGTVAPWHRHGDRDALSGIRWDHLPGGPSDLSR
jgi:hypothetical protein